MKKILLSIIMLLSISCFGQYDTLQMTYTFNNLNTGNLNGQDGWVTTLHNTAIDIQVTQTGSFNGTNAISFNQSGPSVGDDASKPIGLSFPGFNFSNTAATYIITYEFKHNYWGMDLAIAADLNMDGKVTFTDANEKALNFYSGSHFGDRLTTPNGQNLADTVVGANWTKVEMRISQLNMPGGGVVTVSTQDMTTGIWTIYANNVPLGADTTSVTKTNINNWNMLFLHFEGATGLFDNITLTRLTPASTTIPIVSTVALSGLSATSVNCSGNVFAAGGAAVTARGICYGTTANPAVTGPHTIDGSGTGSFIGNITGLLASTTYYARAYATNSFGTAYGADLAFTTSAPTVAILTTDPASSITLNSAVSGGIITSDGGSPILIRGTCINVLPNPTIANIHTNDGSGSGAFTSNLTGLTPSTTYYIRAFASNAIGTAYGNLRTFNTGTVGINEYDETSPRAYISNNFLVISSPASYPTNTNIQLYDLAGKLLITLNNLQPGETRITDISSYPKGIYFIKISTPGNTNTKKLFHI